MTTSTTAMWRYNGEQGGGGGPTAVAVGATVAVPPEQVFPAPISGPGPGQRTAASAPSRPRGRRVRSSSPIAESASALVIPEPAQRSAMRSAAAHSSRSCLFRRTRQPKTARKRTSTSAVADSISRGTSSPQCAVQVRPRSADNRSAPPLSPSAGEHRRFPGLRSDTVARMDESVHGHRPDRPPLHRDDDRGNLATPGESGEELLARAVVP